MEPGVVRGVCAERLWSENKPLAPYGKYLHNPPNTAPSRTFSPMKTFFKALFVIALISVALAAIVIFVPLGGLEKVRATLRSSLRLPEDPSPPHAEPAMAQEKTTVAQPVAPVKKITEAPAYTPRWHALPADQAIAVEARKRLLAIYAEGGVKNARKLHLVYVTTADREPFPDHRERMDRVVKHVRDFYARDMVANGLPPLTFGLDTDENGRVRMYEAKTDLPLSGISKYTNSTKVTREAANKALRAAGIDPEKNHALIICQMPDGIAPYFGGGGYASGCCWICDLADFDPRNLASKLSKEETFSLAKNEEELKAFRGRALGDHTTTYMGGTAHELGHCFNLPHTGDSPEQEAMWGKSLMGSGNYTYGKEERGAGKGSFLNPTDALRLMAQPLFSGIDYRVSEKGKAEFADLKVVPERDGVRITGRIASANIPVYAALVTFLFDKPGGDYPSNSAASLIDPKTGAFSLYIARSYDGPVDIMLTALHANGDNTNLHTRTVSRGFGLNIHRLETSWAFLEAHKLYAKGDTAGALALAKAAPAQYPANPAVAAIAAAWGRALARNAAGPAPVARAASENSVSLVDCAAVSMKSGYAPAPASRDLVPSRDNGPVADIGWRPGARTLFAHAPGAFVFDLGGKWKKLSGGYGVQGRGSIGLEILGDGKVLFSGKTAGAGKPLPFDTVIAGVKRLELRITDGGDGASGDWGVIADPLLSR